MLTVLLLAHLLGHHFREICQPVFVHVPQIAAPRWKLVCPTIYIGK